MYVSADLYSYWHKIRHKDSTSNLYRNMLGVGSNFYSWSWFIDIFLLLLFLLLLLLDFEVDFLEWWWKTVVYLQVRPSRQPKYVFTHEHVHVYKICMLMNFIKECEYIWFLQLTCESILTYVAYREILSCIPNYILRAEFLLTILVYCKLFFVRFKNM